MATDGFPNAKNFFDGVPIYTEYMAMFISGSLLRAGINPDEVVADSLRQDASVRFQNSRQKNNRDVWKAIDFGSIPDLVTKNLPSVERNLTNKLFLIREFRNKATHEYIEKGRAIPNDMSETVLYLMADVLNEVGQTKGTQEVLAIRDWIRQGSVSPETRPLLPSGSNSDVSSKPQNPVTPSLVAQPRPAPPAGGKRRESPNPGARPAGGFGERAGRFSHRADVAEFASMFYRRQLFDYDVPQQMLGKLGISAESAANSGIGFCSGQGLREFLLSKNLDRNEIQMSPLFNKENGDENFAGQMVISDLDSNGKAVWMTSIPIERGAVGYWERFAPFPKFMPGRRHSDIVKIEARTPCDILTNDARLYIVLAASGMRAALMTYWPSKSADIDALCGDLCGNLLGPETTKLSLVMHKHDLRRTLAEKINTERPDVEVLLHSGDIILKNLAPETRDLEALARSIANKASGTKSK